MTLSSKEQRPFTKPATLLKKLREHRALAKGDYVRAAAAFRLNDGVGNRCAKNQGHPSSPVALESVFA